VTYTAPPAFTTRPDLRGTFGMTASTHWLATASAQSVLERGGNAFDAAVAGAFVLHVVEPHLNGPGGDMTAVFATAEEPGRPVVLMGQGPAPAGATVEHYRAEGLDLVPGSGALAAAVPGAVDAWLLLLRDHGTWEVADVLAYAIGYARDGHPITTRVTETIGAVADLFVEHWPTSADRWLVDGAPPAPGEVVTNEAYARVLDGLVAAGGALPSADAGPGPEAPGSSRAEADRRARVDAARTEWAEGLVATSIDAFVRTPHRHSTGGDHAGVLRASDLAAFRASTEEAATVEFRGHVVAKTGAWGQGPLPDELLDPSTLDGAHTIVEAQKLAMADREAWYGDRDVPLDRLLSAEYAAERRALIGHAASHELRPGDAGGAGGAGRLPALRTDDDVAGSGAGVGEPTVGSFTAAPRTTRGSRAPSPTSRRPARPAATPATSTSSTAGETSSRRLPPAGGCSRRRPCPSSASASAAVCR
jgi:gamma-glutamyltranspeptidase/glutathione hydrolase